MAKEEKTDNLIEYLSYCLADQDIYCLYSILNDVITILNKHNITYWIDGGTLLGAVRCGGQICHDDDTDIGILYRDYKNLKKKAYLDLKLMGYVIYEFKEMIKIVNPTKPWYNNGKTIIGSPVVDIFFWKKYNNVNGGLSLVHEDIRKKWPGCWHSNKDFYPLKEYKFGTYTYMGPRNPYPYLDRMYPMWAKEIVVDVRESKDNTGVKVKSIKFSLKEIRDKIKQYIEENKDNYENKEYFFIPPNNNK